MNTLSRSTLILLASSLALAACSGKMKGQKAAGLPTPPVERLDNKTPEEVLKIKYKKADLVCEIRAFAAAEFDPNQPPFEKIKVDLLKVADWTQPLIDRQIQLPRAGIFILRIKPISLRIVAASEHKTRAGSIKVFNSPEIDVDYSGENVASPQDRHGIISTSTIYEAVPRDVVYTGWRNLRDSSPLYNFRTVNCSIETEAKPAYKDQIINSKK